MRTVKFEFRTIVGLLVVPVVISAFAASRAATALEQPLATEIASAFAAVPNDPPPPELVRGLHYVVSNEVWVHLWKEVVTNRGGIQIGVGTDQNYLLAGWSRPEVLILTDFDQWVVDVHAMYRLAFLNAPTPAAFVDMWSAEGADRFVELIEKGIEDPATRGRVLKVFGKVRKTISGRLRVERRRHKENGVASFLNDQAQYDFIVGLFRNNRVFAFRGDLTASSTIRSIGEVATRHGLIVRVLYLSNAERYFEYGDDFRKNMTGLPCDERSIVLRTVGYDDDTKGDPYLYIYQDLSNFTKWLERRSVTDFKPIVRRRELVKEPALFQIRKLPPTRRK